MQPVQLLFSVILARLLTPEDFGILGMTAVFFAIAVQLQGCGFGSALIRDIHRTHKDICTVFWSNISIGLLIALLLCISAPLFAAFFHQDALINLTRVSALMLFLSNTTSVHITLYTCRRDFKTPALISMAATVLPMPFTICAAYLGWGYWALMTQSVLSGLLSLIIIWYVSPWKPSFAWNYDSFSKYFDFGYKVVLRGISFAIFDNIRTFFIGRFYTAAALGEFNRAFHVALLPNTAINQVLGNVTYPILATIQENPERLTQVYSKYIRVTSVVIFPATLLFIFLAKPCILLLFGDQWVNCIEYAQLIAAASLFYHITNINNNILLVKGRSDISLKLDLFKQALHIALMIPALFISVKAVCWVAFITAPINTIMSIYISSRLVPLSVFQQLRDFVPYMLTAFLCAAPAGLVNYLNCNDIVKILLGAAISSVLYFGILYWRRDEQGALLVATVKQIIFKKKAQA